MTLKLTLKKKWFEMIASGIKTEEYREIKPHWIKRLYGYWGKRKYTKEEVEEFYIAKTEGLYSWLLQNHVLEPFKFNKIEFTNGYGKVIARLKRNNKVKEINKINKIQFGRLEL